MRDGRRHRVRNIPSVPSIRDRFDRGESPACSLAVAESGNVVAFVRTREGGDGREGRAPDARFRPRPRCGSSARGRTRRFGCRLRARRSLVGDSMTAAPPARSIQRLMPCWRHPQRLRPEEHRVAHQIVGEAGRPVGTAGVAREGAILVLVLDVPELTVAGHRMRGVADRPDRREDPVIGGLSRARHRAVIGLGRGSSPPATSRGSGRNCSTRPSLRPVPCRAERTESDDPPVSDGNGARALARSARAARASQRHRDRARQARSRACAGSCSRAASRTAR